MPISSVGVFCCIECSFDYEFNFTGLAPGKNVGLKYAFPIRCDSFEKNSAGEVSELRCTRLPVTEKPKGTVQWVAASTALTVEVRLYGHLFTVEEVDDEIWEEQLNPASEFVVSEAMVSGELDDCFECLISLLCRWIVPF